MASSPDLAPTEFANSIEEAANQLANSSKAQLTSPPPASSPPQDPPESPPPAASESSPPAPPTSPPPTSSPPPAAVPPPPEEPPSAPPPSTPPHVTASPPPPPVNSSPPPSTTTPSPTPPAPTNAPATPGSPPAPVFSPPPAPRAAASPAPPLPYNLSPPRTPNSAPPNKSSGSLSGPGAPPSPPSDSNASTAIIAGIVVGGVVFLALIAACLILSRRRKRPSYYMDPSRPPPGGDQYYNASAQWNSPLMDQTTNINGLMGTPVTGWGAPPPPPPANTSSDFSSGYSGQHPTPMQQPPSSPFMGGIGSKSQFTYEELAAATGGFSQANLLGQGGFGFVHKGVLPDGTEVAVKSLKSGSGQGEREFQAEVEIISRVHHRHLVSLVGYCIAEGQRMLVYEFVANKTLEFHLYGKGQPVMDWATRLRIAVGSAKGLAYLHEDCHPRIIHRDIKAANILLDLNFEAMVADFGLAKLTSDNFTHVSTRVMGTFGYLAPEYASSGKLTEKSDVFSFGVMLLELITGRRPVDLTNRTMEDSLVDWARPLLSKSLEDGNYKDLVDPRLEDNYIPNEMSRMISCAAASIRHSARRRPKMSQIVRALEGDSSLEDLNEGVKPGQSAAYDPSGKTSAYDTGAYNADMMKFRKMVMSSQEFNSSEYGETSEYGLNPSGSSSSDHSKEIAKSSHAK
ncbi:proline-rich receptor-like protein kinase PERK15 [Henckelia pumila]|uniref:proline-rich receptor-like protein kinase PERK15 n=1 Tax=Henckelia pumila TaxID=405737 RepID=UPI003C6E76A0